MFALFLWVFACGETEKIDDDRDQDGFSNSEEEAAGTNPDYAYSHPYEQGGYNVGYCSDGVSDSSGPSGQTTFSEDGQEMTWYHYENGDIVENFQLKDQYGQDVDLYSFCGNHIMLVIASFT